MNIKDMPTGELFMEKVAELNPDPDNPRHFPASKFNALAKSIKEFPKMMWLRPLVVERDSKTVKGGNFRLKVVEHLGWELVPVVYADTLTEEELERFMVLDNVNFGEWDKVKLAFMDSVKLSGWGMNTKDIFGDDPTSGEGKKEIEEGAVGSGSGKPNGALQERFIVPPFSVLDRKQGYWQDRRKMWLDTGMDSELGRDEVMPTWNPINDYVMGDTHTSSVFDPVLAEIAYRWFCPTGGTVFDPFAGGVVRGAVAAMLGYHYHGIDIRQEQVEENRRQAEAMSGLPHAPEWSCADAIDIIKVMKRRKADFIFSCPPYFDLEKYSELDKDLSNMEWEGFCSAYSKIIHNACLSLKKNRFACFVVSNVRDKEGFYRRLVSLTEQAFEDAGLRLYNELILVNVVGSLSARVTKYFNGGRKVGKMHDNVLVFYKGDPKKIKENYPFVETGFNEDEEPEND